MNLKGKAGRDAHALFDPTAGGKSAPARSVGSSVSSGARRRRLGHWRGHRRGRLGRRTQGRWRHGCRECLGQMDAAPELQPSLSNAVFRSPCPSLLIRLIPPQCGHLHIPFAFFCAFLPRPLAIPSLPQTQFQPTRLQKRFRDSTFAMGSVPVFSPCPQPHGPHLSLGGSGLCSNLCST